MLIKIKYFTAITLAKLSKIDNAAMGEKKLSYAKDETGNWFGHSGV